MEWREGERMAGAVSEGGRRVWWMREDDEIKEQKIKGLT